MSSQDGRRWNVHLLVACPNIGDYRMRFSEVKPGRAFILSAIAIKSSGCVEQFNPLDIEGRADLNPVSEATTLLNSCAALGRKLAGKWLGC